MHFNSLDAFLNARPAVFAKGPSAMIFAEDEVELNSTLRHHHKAGFQALVLFAPARFKIDRDLTPLVIRVDHDLSRDLRIEEVVTRANNIAPGAWLYYCFNGEYLVHPFCESRTVGEMLAFHAEERREAMLTFVVDLYAGDLETAPNAVTLDDVWLDRSGYYALNRQDPSNGYKPKDRQLDFYGGLKWRFEEHVPYERRRIDRVSLFRAKPGLALKDDFTFNDEEYNTVSCKWHHNLTAAVCSFRAAKALKRNPGSTYEISTFRWHNSARFDWSSTQLMSFGLIEPGQWF